uniref:Uncharacterized protein n=1 Tax=Triticum urartu TaxID=4572 RepID=A0A8R7P4K2_TRIUA
MVAVLGDDDAVEGAVAQDGVVASGRPRIRRGRREKPSPWRAPRHTRALSPPGGRASDEVGGRSRRRGGRRGAGCRHRFRAAAHQARSAEEAGAVAAAATRSNRPLPDLHRWPSSHARRRRRVRPPLPRLPASVPNLQCGWALTQRSPRSLASSRARGRKRPRGPAPAPASAVRRHDLAGRLLIRRRKGRVGEWCRVGGEWSCEWI